ncbi:MAG: flagellar transcriptional regulator FlhD [Betaproteobacteria bacterium]|nr:flagellar transcriptional regulator FlhD [Betaproteobacteria bacterium]MDE2424163.1 flagellar transcriptional regulator FlhD [Betaproteobacteria bacterium]
MDGYERSMVDLNTEMLGLAREMLRENFDRALYELGIQREVAQTILKLSVKEIRQLVSTPVLLVGLRWKNPRVWQELSHYAGGEPVALAQAMLIGEKEMRHGY